MIGEDGKKDSLKAKESFMLGKFGSKQDFARRAKDCNN